MKDDEHDEESIVDWTELGFDPGASVRIGIWVKPSYDEYNDMNADANSIENDESDMEQWNPSIGGHVHAATQTVYANIPSSESFEIRYDRMEYDDISSMRIVFENIGNGESRVFASDIEINDNVPFNISPPRITLLILIALIIVIIRPGSPVRQAHRLIATHGIEHRNADTMTKVNNVIGISSLSIVISLTLAATIMMTLATNHQDTPASEQFYGTDTMQYQHEADAIIALSPSLLIDTPDWLNDMNNPYDAEAREAIGNSQGSRALFDYAYKDGKYYSYFGVAPALIMFAPYKLLTGDDLPTLSAMIITDIIMVSSLWLLSYLALRRGTARVSRSNGVYRIKYKRINPADMIIAGTMVFLCSGVLILSAYPSVYHIAISFGIIFASLGISFWLLSIKENGGLSRVLLAIGSFMMAMTLLSRPQLFLSVLLAFPIFWHHIFHRTGNVSRDFFAFNKNAVVNTLCVIIPFIIIGSITMAWNHIRFGSPFDFGSNYNLTGFDMTEGGASLGSMIFSLVMYTIAPLIPSDAFPFYCGYNASTPFFGGFEWKTATIVEPYYGGVIVFYPAVFFILFSILLINGNKALSSYNPDGSSEISHDTYRVIVIAILVAFLLMIIDSTVAVTQRYQSDFMWLFCFASIIAMPSVIDSGDDEHNKYIDKGNKALIYVLLIMMIWSFILVFMNSFSDIRYESLAVNNYNLFGTISSWFYFLM